MSGTFAARSTMVPVNMRGGAGSTFASGKIKECGKGESLQVAFGHDKTCVINEGGNGYWFSPGINEELKSAQSLSLKGGGRRLFADNGYFFSDSNGTQWHAVNEGGEVCDVAIARDGSWVVIRDHGFVTSQGVSKELSRQLASFYSNHRTQQAQTAAIAA